MDFLFCLLDWMGQFLQLVFVVFCALHASVDVDEAGY